MYPPYIKNYKRDKETTIVHLEVWMHTRVLLCKKSGNEVLNGEVAGIDPVICKRYTIAIDVFIMNRVRKHLNTMCQYSLIAILINAMSLGHMRIS